jgi:ABC-type glucose/galactose transport system permease subunit
MTSFHKDNGYYYIIIIIIIIIITSEPTFPILKNKVIL